METSPATWKENLPNQQSNFSVLFFVSQYWNAWNIILEYQMQQIHLCIYEYIWGTDFFTCVILIKSSTSMYRIFVLKKAIVPRSVLNLSNTCIRLCTYFAGEGLRDFIAWKFALAAAFVFVYNFTKKFSQLLSRAPPRSDVFSSFLWIKVFPTLRYK